MVKARERKQLFKKRENPPESSDLAKARVCRACRIVSTRKMTVLTTWRVFPVCAVFELELWDIDVPALPRATAVVKDNLKILRLRVREMMGC